MVRRWMLAVVCLAATAVAQSDVQSLIDGGHWKRARTIVEDRLKKNPNDADALQLKSRLVMNTDLDQAIQLVEKSVQINPNSADAWAQVANVKGTKAEKASVFSQMGLARDAKKAGDKAIELNPNHPDALNFLIVFHREAPGIVGGDKKKMQEYIDRLLKADPVRANFVLADNARDAKQPEKIEGFYKMAVQANPKDYRARINLSRFYANDRSKNYAAAEENAREALKIDPTRSQAWGLMASILALQKKWGDLESTVAQAEKSVPDNLNPYYQAARIMIATGENFPLAEKYLRKYLTQEPEPNAPDFAAAHWQLSQLLEKSGKKQDAIAELQLAVRLKPDFEQAKKDLKRLGA